MTTRLVTPLVCYSCHQPFVGLIGESHPDCPGPTIDPQFEPWIVRETEDLNVIIPHVGGINAFQAGTLTSYGFNEDDLHYHNVAGDPDEYGFLMENAWYAEEKFIVVEDDVIPWPTSLSLLWSCEHPWCAYPYLINGHYIPALGCTKFDPAKLGNPWELFETRKWWRLDVNLFVALDHLGQKVHVHYPPVIHLNEDHI